MQFQKHFDLDIPRAIKTQLVAFFESLDSAPLGDVAVLHVAGGSGVYGLFLSGELVYVGKAGHLKRRLIEHRNKIGGRKNIALADVRFVCLTVNENWSAYAPEDILTRHYRASGLCEWNGSSFGPHDPGRNRETTNKPTQGFDQRYPIKEDWPCDWLDAGTYPVLDLLLSLKENLPYLLRYQTSDGRSWRMGHEDFDGKMVTVPAAGLPADEVLRLVVRALPGWQATVFPSHMILYKEQRTYKRGRVL